VDHAGLTHIFAKRGIADLKELNVPLDTYYFCQNYDFMFNFKVKLTRQQSKMSSNSFEQQNCDHSNNKTAIVAQWGDDGDGHSGLSQQLTMKLTTLIDTMVI
jgi:hypothetical protein